MHKRKASTSPHGNTELLQKLYGTKAFRKILSFFQNAFVKL